MARSPKRKARKSKGKKKSKKGSPKKSKKKEHGVAGIHWSIGQKVYSDDLPTLKDSDDTVYGSVVGVDVNRIQVDFPSKHGGKCWWVKIDHTKWMALTIGLPKIVHIHKKLTQAEQDDKDEKERIAEEVAEATELSNNAADQMARWFEHVEKEFNKIDAEPNHKALDAETKKGVPAFSVAATLATRDCETIHDMSQDSDEEMEDGEEVPVSPGTFSKDQLEGRDCANNMAALVAQVVGGAKQLTVKRIQAAVAKEIVKPSMSEVSTAVNTAVAMAAASASKVKGKPAAKGKRGRKPKAEKKASKKKSPVKKKLRFEESDDEGDDDMEGVVDDDSDYNSADDEEDSDDE